MTDLLVRMFVKDHENVKEPRVRTAYGVLASCVALFCNMLLFLLKLVVGLFTHSVSIVADAFNNLSDSIANLISLAGIRMAEKPADRQHPFGHGRMEYLAALIVAFLVMEVGFSFLKESVQKLLHPETLVFEWFAVAALLFSIAVKLWMAYFNYVLGKKVDSAVMKATAADAFGDVLATAVTLLSLFAYTCFDVNVDGAAGIIVAICILMAGIDIIKTASAPLLGGSVDAKLYRQISAFVESYDGIFGTHDLVVHNYGPTRSMASIHVEISSDEEFVVLHELVDQIEREAKEKLGVQLVIHMDPVELHSEEVTLAKYRVETILVNLDARLGIHDFQMTHCGEEIHLLFDLTVPYDYDEAREQEIKRRLEQILWLQEPRYRCVITFDRSYVEESGI